MSGRQKLTCQPANIYIYISLVIKTFGKVLDGKPEHIQIKVQQINKIHWASQAIQIGVCHNFSTIDRGSSHLSMIEGISGTVTI